MDVSATTGTSPGVQNATAQSGGAATVSKDEFLMLFTAQLRYQNPLNPLNSTDFTSQLAQFSALEQLQGINGQLEQMRAQQKFTEAAFSTGLIGKKVKFAGDRVYLKGNAEISYTLPADAAAVKVIFFDGSGKTVRELVAGQQKAGAQSVTWDGRDKAGVALPEGVYTFKVEATGPSGAAMQVGAMSAGTVTGVGFIDNDVELSIDDAMTARLGDLYHILGGGN
jgi:flagellar basal-body rod modification protein FlgD